MSRWSFEKSAFFVFVGIFFAQSFGHAEVCRPHPEQISSSKTGPIATTSENVLVVTHASREFHSRPETINGIQNTILGLKDRAQTLYIHTGSYSKAFYPHCEPFTFYQSSSGKVALVLGERTHTLILIGGHYLQCLNDTWVGVARAIRELPKPRSLRLIFPLDGVFDLLDGLFTGYGLINSTLYQRLRIHPQVGLNLNHWGFVNNVDRATAEKVLAHYFLRASIPNEYTIEGHLFGQRFEIKKGKGPFVLRVDYVNSSDLPHLLAVDPDSIL